AFAPRHCGQRPGGVDGIVMAPHQDGLVTFSAREIYLQVIPGLLLPMQLLSPAELPEFVSQYDAEPVAGSLIVRRRFDNDQLFKTSNHLRSAGRKPIFQLRKRWSHRWRPGAGSSGFRL